MPATRGRFDGVSGRSSCGDSQQVTKPKGSLSIFDKHEPAADAAMRLPRGEEGDVVLASPDRRDSPIYHRGLRGAVPMGIFVRGLMITSTAGRPICLSRHGTSARAEDYDGRFTS